MTRQRLKNCWKEKAKQMTTQNTAVLEKLCTLWPPLTIPINYESSIIVIFRLSLSVRTHAYVCCETVAIIII
ncbi:hypothetical protein D918_06243 [Trichuris suis]|nr:hypothetical protein D918_06243 [Trichuris suis]